MNIRPAAVIVHKKVVVTNDDLAAFMKLIDCTDGGPIWQPLMERSITGMSYQCWRREPEVVLPYSFSFVCEQLP